MQYVYVICFIVLFVDLLKALPQRPDSVRNADLKKPGVKALYHPDLDEIKKSWDSIDIDGDGKLSKEDFAAAVILEGNMELTDVKKQEYIDLLFYLDEIDLDNDDFISLEEFVEELFGEFR